MIVLLGREINYIFYMNNFPFELQESMYPEAITETIFDFVPKQSNLPIVSVNFLERLWGKNI